jgi:hypothetical protein
MAPHKTYVFIFSFSVRYKNLLSKQIKIKNSFKNSSFFPHLKIRREKCCVKICCFFFFFKALSSFFFHLKMIHATEKTTNKYLKRKRSEFEKKSVVGAVGGGWLTAVAPAFSSIPFFSCGLRKKKRRKKSH